MDKHLSNHPAEGVLSMVGLMAEHGFHVNPKRIRRLFKIMDYCGKNAHTDHPRSV
jgi:putative transposase